MTTDPPSLYGTGPIIHGPDPRRPGHWVIDHNDQIQSVTTDELAHIPITQQWITWTNTGLIASWPTRHIAEAGRPLLGQILPTTITTDMIGQHVAILTDPNGHPLPTQP